MLEKETQHSEGPPTTRSNLVGFPAALEESPDLMKISAQLISSLREVTPFWSFAKWTIDDPTLHIKTGFDNGYGLMDHRGSY